MDFPLTAAMFVASWFIIGLSLSISGRFGSFRGCVIGGPSSGPCIAVSWVGLMASVSSVIAV